MTLTYHPGILGPVVRPLTGTVAPAAPLPVLDGLATGPAYPGYLPQVTREYLFVPVSAPAGLDVTALTAGIAVVAEGAEPAAGDWQSAVWLDGDAALLIGPGAQTYPSGHYMVWLRLTAGTQQPVMQAGRVRVGDPRF